MPTPKKIDSNVTGLAIAEESALGVLPGSPKWYVQEPNSYSDFGAENQTVARAPINASRQRKKGTVTDKTVTSGYASDFTQNNMTRLLQGFFFADAREKASSQPFNGAAVALTATTATTYTAAAGLGAFKAGHIVKGSGFGNSANNAVKVLSAATATTLTTTGLAVEAPSAAAKVEAVGFQFPAADVDLAVVGGMAVLQATATDLSTLGLTVGEWVFLGGDAANTYFNAATRGYARIKTIGADEIVFDDTTFTPAAVVGTGKTVQLYFGTVLRNEKDPSLIKRRSYQLERTLGNDGDGTQAEYIKGAVANEFTLNIPGQDKLTADLSFVPTDSEYTTGLEGLKAGDRIDAAGEDAYNTSSDLYRLKLNILDAATSNPTPLFGYATEGSIAINNGATPVKVLGETGAVEVSAGDFMVSGSITALFSTVGAVKAVNDNADVALNGIFSRENTGFVFDIPLLQLAGGKLNVEKDQPINIPLTQEGAENAAGYTLLANFFSYLPNAAM